MFWIVSVYLIVFIVNLFSYFVVIELAEMDRKFFINEFNVRINRNNKTKTKFLVFLLFPLWLIALVVIGSVGILLFVFMLLGGDLDE